MIYYSARHKQRVHKRMKRQLRAHLITALVVVLAGIAWMVALYYGITNLPSQ